MGGDGRIHPLKDIDPVMARLCPHKSSQAGSVLGPLEVLSSKHVCSEDANLAEEAAENTGFKGEVE